MILIAFQCWLELIDVVHLNPQQRVDPIECFLIYMTFVHVILIGKLDLSKKFSKNSEFKEVLSTLKTKSGLTLPYALFQDLSFSPVAGTSSCS